MHALVGKKTRIVLVYGCLMRAEAGIVKPRKTPGSSFPANLEGMRNRSSCESHDIAQNGKKQCQK